MKIIFLFSGQSRTSPFNINPRMVNKEILKSYNDFIFTREFKELYNYKIYITTDDIKMENTINYFSLEKIGNIHLLNPTHPGEYYFKSIKNKLRSVSEYIKVYNKKDWSNHEKYENSIHQHYKIMDCYNLLANDEDLEDCDYIVRMRMDTKFTINIIDLIKLLQNTQFDIIMNWDFFAIGRLEIMKCYCTGLNNNYGNYNYNTDVPNILPIMHDYNSLERYRWTFSPERQLFEMIFEYCNKKKLDINSAIKNINCCVLVRNIN